MQLIVVVGAPRSGTTLLQNLITAHPDVSSAPETHFFAHSTPALVYERGLPPIGKGRLRTQISRDRAAALVRRLCNAMELEPGLADEILPAPDQQNMIPLRQLATAFFEHLAGGAPCFLEKSPPHAFFIREIRALFPDVKIINIIRDPRDVIASINDMLGKQGKEPRSIFERSRTWNASLKAAADHDLFSIRYEDLVLEQDTTMQRVFHFLGMDATRVASADAAAAATTTTRTKETWKTNNFAPVSSAMIGKYVQRLTPPEIGQVERLCRRHMTEWGYDASIPQQSRHLPWNDMRRYYTMRLRRLTDAVVARARHT